MGIGVWGLGIREKKITRRRLRRGSLANFHAKTQRTQRRKGKREERKSEELDPGFITVHQS